MDSRLIVVLSLCGVLVLAGCSGLYGGESPSTPDGGGENSPTALLEYPDGYAESGITDGEIATQTHTDAIGAYDNFTITYMATVEAENQTTVVNFTRRVDAREQRSYLISEITGAGSVQQYHANGTVYARAETSEGGDVHYSSRDRELDLASASGVRFVRPIVSNVTYGPSEQITRDGEPRLRYEATNLDVPQSLLGDEVSPQNVTGFSASLTVDGNGLVRTITYAATIQKDGQERSVTVDVHITGLSETTVRRPDWVDEAAS